MPELCGQLFDRQDSTPEKKQLTEAATSRSSRAYDGVEDEDFAKREGSSASKGGSFFALFILFLIQLLGAIEAEILLLVLLYLWSKII